MTFLEGLRNRAARALGGTGWTEPVATDVVIADRFDRANWDEISKFRSIRRFTDEMRVDHSYVEDFLNDVYQLTSKAIPRLRFQEELKLSHRPHRPVLSTLKDSAEFRELRTLTVGDPYAAAMGLVSMQDELRDTLARLQHARERANEASEKREQVRKQLEEQGPGLAQFAQPDADAPEPTQDQIDEIIDTLNALEDTEQEAKAAEAAAEAAAEKVAHDVKQQLRQAAKKAADERQEEDALVRSYGVNEGQLKRMSFDKRAALSEKLAKSKMAKFADLIGQFNHVGAAANRHRVKHAPDEVTNVHLSDDLTRLAPAEYINLALPETQTDFWMRFTERTLLTYELSGTEKLGEGPIIVVCDESESMGKNQVMGGTAEAWSKAFALALLTQAKKRDRDFIYIGFSNRIQQHTIVMEGKDAPLDKVLEMTEHFFDGGTYYETPLEMALEWVEKYEAAGKAKPDIVFITDQGYGNISETLITKWKEVKERTSLTCFGVAVCTSVNGVLDAVCDNTRSITEMTSAPSEVADIFRAI